MVELVATALAAVLATSSVTAAVRLSGDGSTASLMAAPLPTPTASPTPSLSPLPTATPTALPTVLPTVSLPPRPTLPVVTADATPRPPAPPPAPGHWRHTENGVTLDLRLSPAVPRAGQLVTWTLTMSGRDGCCYADVHFGDAQGLDGPGGECVDFSDYPEHTAQVVTVRHAYRHAGTYDARVGVAGLCIEGPGEIPHFMNLRIPVRVVPGPLRSNGPALPVISLDDSVAHSGADPGAGQYFVATVSDRDGAPWSWWWDWGDGSRTPVVRNTTECFAHADDGWPEADATSYLAHRYTEPGTYTVRFTATTAGCDGKDPQTVSATMTWTVEPQDVQN